VPHDPDQKTRPQRVPRSLSVTASKRLLSLGISSRAAHGVRLRNSSKIGLQACKFPVDNGPLSPPRFYRLESKAVRRGRSRSQWNWFSPQSADPAEQLSYCPRSRSSMADGQAVRRAPIEAESRAASSRVSPPNWLRRAATEPRAAPAIVAVPPAARSATTQFLPWPGPGQKAGLHSTGQLKWPIASA